MIKHTILALLAGIVVFLVYLVTYVGAFRDVKLSVGTAEPFVLLGRDHEGAYHKIVATIQEVEAWAKEHGIDCSQSFGLYLDDPRRTEEGRLKSFGGCWVKSAPEGVVLPEGFRIMTWQAPRFVKAIFEGSPGIGPMKVYPRADEEIEKQNYKRLPGVLEVYVIHAGNEMTTTYYFPIE